MANKPVLGITRCPHCRFPLPVYWNGIFSMKCSACGKPFKVKRQKLFGVMPCKKEEGAYNGSL